VPSVYVETSIISYLAARPSRDLIVAARQQLTHTWWRERRPLFDLYVSQVVLDEILAGDPDAAGEQLWPRAFPCWTSHPRWPTSPPP
jgi:hypothetical protein